MSTGRLGIASLGFLGGLVGCAGASRDEVVVHQEVARGPVAFVAEHTGAVAEVSVTTFDRSSPAAVSGDATLPVEARLLVLSADGSEPELDAIRSVLDHRGVPHDVFIATEEPALTASRLRSGGHGFYQGIILTSSSLSSALSAAEWAVLADYEAAFLVRRAVLAASADPALGFGSATQQNTSTTPLGVHCTGAGQAVFRDVQCGAEQTIRGGVAILSTPTSGAPLTPLLTDDAGHALAAIHQGDDGRESLLLLFRNATNRLHSQLFLHGVLGWVAGGTYLGERRIDLSAQLDDMFIASSLWGGGTYRLDDDDLEAALAWVSARRSQAVTPDFRVAFAYNATGADDGDPLTAAAIASSGEWYWINHTFHHAVLDQVDYATAYQELASNEPGALGLSLLGFDERNLVTPNVSGLVNADAMWAASDVGIRYAVTDTSRPGCDNPSPNTTFYNAYGTSILLVPRRPTNLFYNVSTPGQWVGEYNDLYRDYWGRDLTYPELLDVESEVLLHYLLRGDADPWMFHQANLRAHDGTHSLLGDLVDAAVTKLAARSRVPVRTPPMHEIGLRFARRLNVDTAGTRATLFRGRALVIDAGRAVLVPVTGVRAADGEAYGGDVLDLVLVVPGTSTCVPLDGAGLGCDPAPVRDGGPGPTSPLTAGICDGSGVPHPPPPPPPPIDAGVSPPPDAWVPPPDAWVPPPDAAVPPPDASVPPPDAAVPPPDAAVPAPDASVPPPPDASVPASDATPPPDDAAASCGGCATDSRSEPSTVALLLLVGFALGYTGRNGGKRRHPAGRGDREHGDGGDAGGAAPPSSPR